MQLERMQNESDFEYHKRLVLGKLVDKTLADADYTELAELALGYPYSSDVARRMFYGSRITLDLLDKEKESGYSESDLISELKNQKIELQKERQRFFDQRREFNKAVSYSGRKEHMFDTLSSSAQNLINTVGVIYNEFDIPLLPKKDNEAVLVLSDWHYGMTVNNAFNSYNTEIAKQRIQNVTASAIERICLHQCSKLHIVVLGDLFHGAIHTSARVASEELVCDQIMQVSEILAQTIEILSKSVCETFVYTTYGNHARTVQNKNDSIHRDNIERIIPWWLNQRLSNCDNVVVTPESEHEFIFVNACGHDICASHGDLDSVKSATRTLPALLNKRYHKNIEYILLGDKHHHESFDELGVTAIVCGSLCGSDDYANNKRLFSTPSQLMLIVNNTDGVDAEYRLKC